MRSVTCDVVMKNVGIGGGKVLARLLEKADPDAYAARVRKYEGYP